MTESCSNYVPIVSIVNEYGRNPSGQHFLPPPCCAIKVNRAPLRTARHRNTSDWWEIQQPARRLYFPAAMVYVRLRLENRMGSWRIPNGSLFLGLAYLSTSFLSQLRRDSRDSLPSHAISLLSMTSAGIDTPWKRSAAGRVSTRLILPLSNFLPSTMCWGGRAGGIKYCTK